MAGVHVREAEVGDGTSRVAGTTTAGAGSRPRMDGPNEIWYEAGEWEKKDEKIEKIDNLPHEYMTRGFQSNIRGDY
jgi:hypothetical protein